MRTVFVGASSLAVATARILLRSGHDVVMIERDVERIDALAQELACGFLHADGARPAVLREADPAHSDFLFCLTDNDETNIIASLVGRSLGFGRVVTKVDEPEFEHICVELGLIDIVVPDRTIGRHLAEMVAGQDPLEISAMIKGEARVFSFVVPKEAKGAIADLELPDQSRVVCVYRGKEFLLPGDDFAVKVDDEVVLVTHRRNLAALAERWHTSTEGGS
jgi:trk system potassium uptake protein TrkA